MKTIRVTRAVRSATAAELQAAVAGEPLPNATHALANGKPLARKQAAALRKPPLGKERIRSTVNERVDRAAAVARVQAMINLRESLIEICTQILNAAESMSARIHRLDLEIEAEKARFCKVVR